MKATLLGLTFLVSGCAYSSAPANDAPSDAPPSQTSCVTVYDVAADQCGTDGYHKTTCRDDTPPFECADRSDIYYDGNYCPIERTYTEYRIDTDCATYKAANPDLFN